jgi:large subunit ribosomal protein L31e
MSGSEEKKKEEPAETEKIEEPTEEEKELEEGKIAEPATEEKVKELPEETTEEGEEKLEETALEEEMKEEAEAIEEEKVEKPKGKEEKEEDIVEEKFYTIPLRRVWVTPPQRRAPRAIRLIRSYVEKHMKIGAKETEEETEEEEEERLLISSELNERIWQRGIRKPPRRIKVRVVKDSEGNVTVYPA